MEIQLEYWHIIMCFVRDPGGGISPFHAPLLNLVLLSHPRSIMSGSATES